MLKYNESNMIIIICLDVTGTKQNEDKENHNSEIHNL